MSDEQEVEPARADPLAVAREVSVEEQLSASMSAMIVAPARALGGVGPLLQRCKEFGEARGWHPDGARGFGYLAVAAGAYKLGIRGQRFKLPRAFVAHPRWASFEAVFGDNPTADEIVEAMELDDLLIPG